jgi:antitoxin YefM
MLFSFHHALTEAASICTVSLYVNLEVILMPIQTTYTRARANLAKLCDEVAKNQEIVIINRRGSHDVALVSAEELSGLMETAHLLRSPKNAERLLTALNRVKAKRPKPKSVASLRKELGLGEKE